MEILNTVIENFDNIALVGGAVLAIAGVIIRLTPTKADDKVFDVIKRGIALIKKNVKVEDLESIKNKIETFKTTK